MSAIEASSGSRLLPSTRACSLVAVAIVLIVSTVVLVGGWLFGSSLLVRLLPSFAAMVPSTALSFFGLGAVLLWRLSAEAESHWLTTGSVVVAAIVAAMAVGDLAVIYSGTANSVDVLFWPSFPAGRDGMSPATAVCFLLASPCVAMMPWRPRKTAFAYVTCATAGLLIAMVAIVGYAFDVKSLYQVAPFTAMALHTGLTFIALYMALLLMRPEIGWMAILLAPKAGSAGARRLFPIILLLPFVFCLAALTANKTGLFDVNFSLFLLVIATTVLLAASVLQNATIENRAEQRLIATMRDLNTALSDRDLLLREVYHRVKNNLQQINALIHMETSKISDARAKAAFRSTAGRVNALGTVHRLLISSPSISKLSTATFFKDLCENIGASFDADGQGIAVLVDADDLPITIDAAIPLGMLVNETVTNALKHAFRGRPTGEILVRFKVEPDGGGELTIADNGIGIPEARLDPSSSGGSGSRIIRSFIRQIRGDLSIDVTAGTTFTIRVPRSLTERGRNA